MQTSKGVGWTGAGNEQEDSGNDLRVRQPMERTEKMTEEVWQDGLQSGLWHGRDGDPEERKGGQDKLMLCYLSGSGGQWVLSGGM